MASRQSGLCVFTGVVAALLGFASVPAFSSGANAGVTAEQRCLASKLEAASQYGMSLEQALEFIDEKEHSTRLRRWIGRCAFSGTMAMGEHLSST